MLANSQEVDSQQPIEEDIITRVKPQVGFSGKIKNYK